jgi:hypothetical protein
MPCQPVGDWLLADPGGLAAAATLLRFQVF